MSLTPEQFNLLATRDDLKNLVTKDEVSGLASKEDINRIEETLDFLVSSMKSNSDDKTVHREEHDRINRDLWRVKNHEVEKMEVVQPLEV